MNKNILTGIVIILIIGAYLAGRNLSNNSNKPNSDTNIIFPHKNFYDNKDANGDGFVEADGTLTGNGIGYKNNVVDISCHQDQMTCYEYEVDQIGTSQIGDLQQPTTFTVTTWNSTLIVATTGDDGINCSKTTINIDRTTGTAEWVQEPINQSKMQCQTADDTTYKWSIEDSLYWQQWEKQ